MQSKLSLIVLLVILGSIGADPDEDIPHNEVRNWALKFGVDLWEFGRHFTKISEIKNKYKDLDVEVVRKDGIILLREMAAEVKNFMDFKMNAVMRIMDSAEQAALGDNDVQQTSPSSSSHSSSSGEGFYDARVINQYAEDGRPLSGSKELLMRTLRRFDRLPVNLTHSTILQAASDVDLEELKSSFGWTAHLDPLFANNIERDPALSWQYFGSTNGLLRRFPGTSWPPEGFKSNQPLNDYRTEDWFIQAVSSPKDIFILLDGSKSMCGRSHALVKATVNAILDTLGDNDFVNVAVFDEVPQTLIGCFHGKMIRATPDNKQELKQAVANMECRGSANFTAGLELGFQVLHQYNQSGQGSQCNQAIMLVTTGTSDSNKEVIKQYNWPHMPVRIFTYLIKGDSSSRETLHNMACENKGYFASINTEEDAKKRVLDYAMVMARPMVLYQADHPIHWSPVFVGGRSGLMGSDSHVEKRRLVTSVTTPVFDRRNHSVRSANLLGVVGTDVPIEEIQKMVPQHKLGANGYSFIVDNNGRILYHPDLRPLDDGSQYSLRLKPKYSSVDLSEVEMPESETSSETEQDINMNLLLDMRQEMVEHKENEAEISVLQHMDHMKRVQIKTLRYYYGPIEGTPFSLALALPEKYGMHELHAQQEIRHSPLNVTEYLKGDKWKIHPDWVYCEYNSPHDLERERENSGELFARDQHDETMFDSPENQLLHFLARAGRPGWKWMSVRSRSPQSHHHGHKNGGFSEHNSPFPTQGSRKAEPYYCDRNLVQSLVRDAMVTDELDKNPMHPAKKDQKQQQGYQMFGITTSFVATRSGLLRWVDHVTPDETQPHFSDINNKATDEIWYKRAVDQHSIEPDSFVFSVPFDSGYTDKADAPLVTATHAIFIEHRGHKAPAAVVGLQFQHDSLARHFINITSACTMSSNCKKTCASDDLDCYLLDNHGFIVLSENTEDTGAFFGRIDGTIMDSLVQDRIYRRVAFMDYQGACSDNGDSSIAAAEPVRPTMLAWIRDFIVVISMSWLSIIPGAAYAWPHAYNDEQYEDPEMVDMDDYNTEYELQEDYHTNEDVTNPQIIMRPTETPAKPPASNPTPPPPVTTSPRITPDLRHARSCDLKTELYLLQPDRLNASGQSNPLKGKLTNCHASGCERPFSVQKIPNSNLILLVVDTTCPCGTKQLDIEPLEVTDGRSVCGNRRMTKESLPRKRPQRCINYHPEETEIQQCGRAPASHLISIATTVVSLAVSAFLAW